jgi:hypothetical protein
MMAHFDSFRSTNGKNITELMDISLLSRPLKMPYYLRYKTLKLENNYLIRHKYGEGNSPSVLHV